MGEDRLKMSAANHTQAAAANAEKGSEEPPPPAQYCHDELMESIRASTASTEKLAMHQQQKSDAERQVRELQAQLAAAQQHHEVVQAELEDQRQQQACAISAVVCKGAGV